MSAERYLLFAVLAFENELIDLAQLTSVCRAWAEDKSKPLADLLVERGWLSLKNREFIDELVERKLAKHQHDPRVTLNSVVRGDVCDAIKQVEDADIQQSLSSWPSSGPVLIETIGETLGEPEQPKSRYTWVSEVGKGGLGKVWLARDNDLAREVALKEVKPGSASTEAVRRLIKEAQITGQLQHPNIVPVYEVNRGGRPFYTMKLVKGETLSKAIRRHHEQSRAGHEDPLSLPRLLNVFVNVCEALAYAHSRGIIHRDLKPENIVLGDYGEAIVLDWGLAKQIGSADEETAPVLLTEDAQSQATKLGATPGTPAYMSPEQAAGRVDLMDQRTDIYGLGTILFEILTGQPPHRAAPAPASAPASPATGLAPVVQRPLPYSNEPPAESADKAQNEVVQRPLNHPDKRGGGLSLHALLQRISESPTPRARDVDPTISRELDAVCATAMSKKRDERYLDAKALAADVKRSLAHQPVSVYRTGAWERLRLWRRRNPVVAALSLFLAVSLLTGSVVSTLFGLEANRERTKAVELAKVNATLAGKEKSAREKADLNADAAMRQTKLAERHLYAAHMNLAQSAWEVDQIGETVRLLELHRPAAGEERGSDDLRGFEWFFWDHLCHSDLLTLEGHKSSVGCVVFSPDGKRLASASHDRTVKVWDAATGQESLTLKGHTSAVKSVAFSPDGQRIASASLDKTVKVWDTVNGEELLTLKGHTEGVTSVAFNSDGTRLASTSYDGTVKVWDATTGQESFTLKGHTNAVQSVAFSPDGQRLASASQDQTVKIWDAATGQESLTLKGHNSRVFSVAFSPDGQRLASADSRELKVWDAATGQKSLTLKGHTEGVVTSVAFNSDGTRLASTSYDGTVKVWDATTGQESFTLKGHTNAVQSVAFTPDGKRLASASDDGTVKIWDATSGHPESLILKGHTKTISSVAFSPDGQRVTSASADNTVKVWDAVTGQVSLTIQVPLTLDEFGRGHCVAFSSDGQRLAAASADNTVKVWDVVSGQESLTLKGHNIAVWGVAFSPDGKRLGSACGNFGAPGDVKVWDVMSGQELLTLKGHTYPVRSVAFSPDGQRLASASDDRTVKVWDASAGQELLTLKGHTQETLSVAFSPDGQRLASASADRTVKVWDVVTGQGSLTLKGHTEAVWLVAFSPDGKRLASTSSDGTVKVWDAASGQQTLSLKGHARWFTSVAFSADGKRLASPSADQTVKIWDARPWTPELRAEREALSLIHWLRDQDKPQSEWLAAIAADQTLTEPVRQRALQFAREWK